VVYSGNYFWKRYILSFEWKRVGVMDSDTGADGQMGLDNCVENKKISSRVGFNVPPNTL